MLEDVPEVTEEDLSFELEDNEKLSHNQKSEDQPKQNQERVRGE